MQLGSFVRLRGFCQKTSICTKTAAVLLLHSFRPDAAHATWMQWVRVHSLGSNAAPVAVCLDAPGEWNPHRLFGLFNPGQFMVTNHSYLGRPADEGRLLSRVASALSASWMDQLYPFIPTSHYLLTFDLNGEPRSMLVPARRVDHQGQAYSARLVRWRSAVDVGLDWEGAPFVADWITGSDFDEFSQRRDFYVRLISDLVYQPERLKVVMDDQEEMRKQVSQVIDRAKGPLLEIKTVLNAGKAVVEARAYAKVLESINNLETIRMAISANSGALSGSQLAAWSQNFTDVAAVFSSATTDDAALLAIKNSEGAKIFKTFGDAMTVISFCVSMMDVEQQAHAVHVRESLYAEAVGRLETEERLAVLQRIAQAEAALPASQQYDPAIVEAIQAVVSDYYTRKGQARDTWNDLWRSLEPQNRLDMSRAIATGSKAVADLAWARLIVGAGPWAVVAFVAKTDVDAIWDGYWGHNRETQWVLNSAAAASLDELLWQRYSVPCQKRLRAQYPLLSGQDLATLGALSSMQSYCGYWYFHNWEQIVTPAGGWNSVAVNLRYALVQQDVNVLIAANRNEADCYLAIGTGKTNAVDYALAVATAMHNDLAVGNLTPDGSMFVPPPWPKPFLPGAIPYANAGVPTVVSWGALPTPPEFSGPTNTFLEAATGHGFTVALRTDGSVAAWGTNDYGQATTPAEATNVIAVAAGGAHAIALRSDGTVVAWGRNSSGQAIPPAGLSEVVAIAAGSTHSLALRADGTVAAWGDDYYHQATPPPGLGDAKAIAAGGAHSLALKSDGSVVGWGDNSQGQTSPPTGLSGVVVVAAGGADSLALRDDGTVVGWGGNDSGERTPPEDLSSVVAIAAGASHSLALRSDGVAVGWGRNAEGQAGAGEGSPQLLSIAAGLAHSVGIVRQEKAPSLPIVRGGIVVGWGANHSHQASPPTGLNDVVAISAGWNHSLALKADGTIVGWGDNSFGQLSPPDDLRGVTAIAAGMYYSLASRADGTAVGWGSGYYGQANPPADLTGVKAVAASEEFALALRADDTVAGWGRNLFGQASPPGISGVVAIAAGTSHGLALKADGTVVGWGYNSFGQASPPERSERCGVDCCQSPLQRGSQVRRHGGRLGRLLLGPGHAQRTEKCDGRFYQLEPRPGLEVGRDRGGLGRQRLRPGQPAERIERRHGGCGRLSA
jgi:alpha-tubulin suppressor-like RCC1 family protein